ncbi:MAG: hypothetical protein BWX88_02425 [Planctomycetes bacterium ADurb.Bin126]|nr:MAG: hypothetical protein BWX88_02425 [Planctomycetes bacterium ADurb.Bin126]HOD81160.1 PmoA family protein [Phycisphaerae bacterium]HQL72422.1 PmoA family protein [Phycisphaerae bacterium]
MTHRALSAALLILALAVAAAPAAELVVEAGALARRNVPLCASLPQQADQAAMTGPDGQTVPCQIAEGKLWFILDSLDAGAKKTYKVELGKTADAKGGVSVKEAGSAVEIGIDGKEFTRYELAPVEYKGGQTRRPFFFPLYGAKGVQILRPYPMAKEIPATSSADHPHHTGIWVAYGEVNGVDNWSASPKAGWQVHKGFEVLTGGPVVGVIRHKLDWTDVDKKPNLAEVRTIRVYRLDGEAKLMDIEVCLQAKYGKAHFGDTKEAGIPATRMRDEIRADKKGKGHLLNSEGVKDKATWGKRAKWVDMFGPLDGQEVGYAVFDHPGNGSEPPYWHSRDYGLVTVNPFSQGAFEKGKSKDGYELAEGKELTLRYRIYFHAGDSAAAQVPARYADYAQPPKTIWK